MKALLVVLILLSVGCASTTKQTDELLKGKLISPSQKIIPNVPYVKQTTSNCGPSSLQMVLKWAGKDVEIAELTKTAFTPSADGSFQTDMITAARRQGMVAVPINGLSNLLNEVKEDHPVIIFENLGISLWPQWHYAVIFGYDTNSETLTMHSGPDENTKIDMGEFELSWKLADYWGLVILPPGKLSATASALEQSRAAAALEQLGYIDEAGVTYAAILKRWPDVLIANVGLANTYFIKKRYKKAIIQLEKTTKMHPESSTTWHNLSIAYGTMNLTAKARTSAKRALELANADEKSVFLQNLKPWLD